MPTIRESHLELSQDDTQFTGFGCGSRVLRATITSESYTHVLGCLGYPHPENQHIHTYTY